MFVLISELDQQSTERVQHLWQQLRIECGLKAIYELPTPHLTWFVAEELDILKSLSIIDRLTSETCGFETHCFGLGLFTGARPVLYLPLVKNQAMIDIHQKVWEQLTQCSDKLNKYYEPKFWLPHVTLAVNDVSVEKLYCAIKLLGQETLEIKISIENMIVVAQGADPSNEVMHQFRFCT